MTYTKWLRGLIIGGVFLSLAIPFIVANGNLADFANILFPVNSFFPFITGKNFVFRILIELLFGLYVLLALREPRYRPRSSIVLWAVALFTLWVGVATVLGVDSGKSFWSNFERMEGYITILHLCAYFLVVSAILSTEKLWTRYFQASLGASFLMSLYGIAQIIGWIPIDQGTTRVDGTLGNAIYFSAYMLFNIFFGLVLLYREGKAPLMRWVYGIIVALNTVLLLYSDTRGTILGLIGGAIVGTAYFWYAAMEEGGFRRARTVAAWVLGGIVILAVLFIPLRHASFVQHIPGLDRLATISLSGGEATTRLIIWGEAWHGFLERPITGWGQENFNFVFNKFYQPQLYTQEAWFDRAHNSYVDWLINGGAPGLLLFVSLIGTTLWVFVRNRTMSITERTLLIGLTVAFAVHEFFVFDNIVSWLQFFVLLAFAHACSRRDISGSVLMSRAVSDRGMAVMAPIVIVVTVAGAWLLNAPGIASATTLLRALQPVDATGAANPAASLAYFKQTFASSVLGRQEVTEQLLQAALAVSANQNVTSDIKQQYYDAANTMVTEMTKERPHDARLELFWGTFLNRYGQTAAAAQVLQQSLLDSPKKQQIMFELGVDTYLHAGDVKDALPLLKTAYELDTSYDDARLYYAIALYYAGDNATADQLLIEGFGSVEVDNDTLISAYFQTKQYARVEHILNMRVQKDPSNLQSWVQLAGVYYSAGDKVNTIATLNAAKAANPGAASQIDPLIQQVEQGK